IAAERSPVTGDGAGHAQRGVAVVVPRPEAELDELPKRIKLLRNQLAGAENAKGVVAIFLLHVAEPTDQRQKRLVPADTDELAVFSQQRIASTSVRLDRVVFGKSLGAQQATVDGMVRIAAYANRLSVFDPDQHSAADRAVTTGRRHPALGN